MNGNIKLKAFNKVNSKIDDLNRKLTNLHRDYLEFEDDDETVDKIARYIEEELSTWCYIKDQLLNNKHNGEN